MAVEDVRWALTQPGRWCYGPDQAGLLLAYPHHGTAVGLQRSSRLIDNPDVYIGTKEENGRRDPNTAIVGSDNVDVVITIVQWDQDAIAQRNRTTTTSGGGYSGTGYGGRRAQTIREYNPGVLTTQVPWLFSPLDSDGPAVLIYAPIIYAGPAPAQTDFDHRDPVEWPMVIAACEDANGHVYAVDAIQHLSLT